MDKEWIDDDNKDGLRASYAVTLTGTIGEGKTLETAYTDTQTLAKDKLTYTWESVYAYYKGEEIKWSLTESTVPAGYTPAVTGDYEAGFKVTNTHESKKINIKVDKEWIDDDNKDGLRASYAVTLTGTIGEGETLETAYTDTQTLAKDKLTYTWESVYAYYKGEEIKWSLTESTVPKGYTETYGGNYKDGFTVTNTHEPTNISIHVTKKWDDADNQDGSRPKEIKLNLFANNEIIETVPVKVAEDGKTWEYTWPKLPEYANGSKIEYDVKEVVPTGYTPAYANTEDGILITNKYTPELTHIDIVKVWDDASNQDGARPGSILVRLLADNIEVDNKVINAQAGDKWYHTFDLLPKYRDGGVEIVYTVTEDTVDDYNEPDIKFNKETNTYTITNTYVPEETSVTVNKIWTDADNQDGLRPTSITVNLIADGNKTPVRSESVTPDDDGNWSYTFANLPKYRNGGINIVYTVTENEVKGYTTKIEKIENTENFKITNTHSPELISISGKKSWVDMDDVEGFRPENVTINLLADGKEVRETSVSAETIDDNGDWTYTFANLPKFRDGGTEIVYTVTEDPVEEYETTYEKDDNGKPYIVVNTHTPNDLNITVNKKWVDTSATGIENIYGHTDKVEIKLTGKVGSQEYVSDTQILEADEEGNWTYTWTELPEYREGKLINYTVVEVTDVVDYVPSYTSDDETKTFTVTNTYSPNPISISGTKTWIDEEDNDGIRPESITLVLKDNFNNTIKELEVTPDEEGNWNYTFDNLPETANGETITYTLAELSVEGYESEIKDFNVTNTHEIAKVSFNLEKIWNDNGNNDGKRPESITVTLFANGEKVESYEVTPNEEGKWLYEFKDLPKYKDGALVEYTIEETPVNGYSTSVTNAKDTNDFVVTNTHEDETIEITITKTWDDFDDISKLRPSEIQVELYANGELINTIVISEEDNWEKTISYLPKYENGEEIEYTINELPIKEYDATYDGYNITNKHELGKGNGPEEEPPQTGIITTSANTNNIIYMFLSLISVLGITLKLSREN